MDVVYRCLFFIGNITTMRTWLFLLLASLTVMTSWLVAPAAWAITDIELSDISYKECPEDVGENTFMSGSSRRANCFMITGSAENPSRNPVYDADVYGRIFDANGNPVLPNRTRIGSIDEVPPGTSEFEVRISVPANQPTPLQLENFKASGFSRSVKFRLP
jgi:hypothetical protein